MKNFFKLLTAALAVVMLAGCTDSGEEDSAARVATPTFQCNVIDNTIMVAWEPVANAAYYTIQLNDGEPAKTDLTVYNFDNLVWEETYTVTLVAVSANPELYQDSKPGVKTVTIGKRDVPQYREWYGIPASAISNNGRWVVGQFDKHGMIIDLNTDEYTQFETFDCYDVADSGLIVGSSYTTNSEGVAAYYYNGEYVDVELGEWVEEHYSSCLTAVTPDGKFAVGWAWDTADTYYTRLCGDFIPFTYNIETGKVNVPMVDSDMLIYGQPAAIALKGVSPDRKLFGYENSMTYFSVLWEDEYEPYTYPCLEYDDEYNLIEGFGDSNNLMSQTGRYLYGKGWRNENKNQNFYPAVYDCETGTMLWMFGGYVSAMADNGIAFVNDVPYYLGTTSYVVDTNVDIMVQTPLVDWLKEKHNIDLTEYLHEGIITIGVSEDCNTLVGITNTMDGWMTYVIDLNGVPME